MSALVTGCIGRECDCCSWRKQRGLPSHHCQLKDLIDSPGSLWGRGDNPRHRVAKHVNQEFQDWVGAVPLKTLPPVKVNDTLVPPPPPPVPGTSSRSKTPAIRVGMLTERKRPIANDWRRWSGEECAQWMAEVVELPQYCLTAKQNLSGRQLERVTASVLPNLGIHDADAQQIVMQHVRKLISGETTWRPHLEKAAPPLSARTSRSRPSRVGHQSFGVQDNSGVRASKFNDIAIDLACLPGLDVVLPSIHSNIGKLGGESRSARSSPRLTPVKSAVFTEFSSISAALPSSLVRPSVCSTISPPAKNTHRPSTKRPSIVRHSNSRTLLDNVRANVLVNAKGFRQSLVNKQNSHEGSCARCGWLQECLVKSSDCAHRLCKNCSSTATRTGPLDKLLVKGAEALKFERKCPICSQPWVELQNARGLVGLCISQIRKRAATLPGEAVSRLPPELRTEILAESMPLKPLGVNRARIWLEGSRIETLNLSGLFADSVQSITPAFPGTITTLVLSSVNLSDELLSLIFAQCGKNLKTLQCDMMQTADESRLEGWSLASACHLHTFDMSYHRRIQPASLVALADACGSRLTSIKVAGCISTNDDVLMALTTCNLLEVLDISCTQVTSVALEQVLISCPYIRNLNIADCFKLNGDHVFQICAMTALNLEELGAAGVQDLTDEGLQELLDSPLSPHFKVLNLSRQPNISDASVHLMSRYCKALEDLDLDMCTSISLRCLQRLVIELPRLQIFPLRMIRDTTVKSQLTYILRSRIPDARVELRSHEPEQNALDRFLSQNASTDGLDYFAMQQKSASLFEERLKEAVPNYRDPAVVEFYQAPRRRIAHHRLGMWMKAGFAATRQLHKWLDDHTHDALGDESLVQVRHLVLLKPSLGIFKGTSPLHSILRNNVADYQGLSSVIRLLVEHHANPDVAEAKHGLPPFLTACCLQFPDGVRALLEVTGSSDRFPHCLRNYQASKGYNVAATMQLMKQVRRGEEFETVPETAHLTAKDRSGLMAIHIAAANGNLVGLRTLIARKIDPNALDSCGRTPLWWACRFGQQDVIQELFQDERTNPSIPSFSVGGLPESTPTLVAKICDHQEASDMLRAAIGAREWSELEKEFLGAAAALKEKPAKACQRWLQSAFGPMSGNKSWAELSVFDQSGRSVPPRIDKWQLHSVMLESGMAEAHVRGRMVAEQLLVPLMSLAADLSLKGAPKALMEYLFQQGIPSFGLDPLMEASEKVLNTLGKLGDSLYAGLKRLPKLHLHVEGLIDCNDNYLNQAASWGGVHQAFAHGPLPWLEKERETSIGAAHALLENGSMSGAAEMVEWISSLGSRNILLLRFWASVYDMWLIGEARRVNSSAQWMMRSLKDSLPTDMQDRVRVHSGPLKKLKRIQQKKVEYCSLAPVISAQEEVGEVNSEDYVAFLHEVSAGHGTLQDRMAAGGICDLVRATVECDDEEAAVEICRVALSRKRGEHGLEALRVKNGFHADIPHGSYRDIKIIFLCQGEDESGRPFRHLIECQVMLKDLLALKSCQHAAYRVVRGEFGRRASPHSEE